MDIDIGIGSHKQKHKDTILHMEIETCIKRWKRKRNIDNWKDVSWDGICVEKNFVYGFKLPTSLYRSAVKRLRD